MPRRPHLGVVVPNYGPQVTPVALVDACSAAEQAGCDSVWVTDHIAVTQAHADAYGTITEAVVTAGFLGGQARRLEIGISALVVPQRNPLLTLKQLMSLDYLCGGRLVTAVAAGWHTEEFCSLGAEYASRGRRLDEFLDLAARLEAQSPGPVTSTGPVTMDKQWLAPGPVAGHLKFWSAGNSKRARLRAALLGTWHPVGLSPAEMGAGVEELRELNPDAETVLRCTVSITKTADRSGQDQRGHPSISGPPEWVAERLHEYLDAGCNGFVIMLGPRSPGMAKRIERFTELVWPEASAAWLP